MGNGFQFIDIIIFAMIAGFLVYRLRSVLGRKNGDEQRRSPTSGAGTGSQRGAAPLPDNVIALPDRGRGNGAANIGAAANAPANAPVSNDDEPRSLAAALAQIRSVAGGFDEKGFLNGARAAFGMVVESFARGDSGTLRSLVSEEVFGNFNDVIVDRDRAGDVHETRIDRIRDADILEARMVDRQAFVTVKFVSEQMNVTRDADGIVIDGDPSRTFEVTDIWTFSRNTRSRDPNWTLVETRTPN